MAMPHQHGDAPSTSESSNSLNFDVSPLMRDSVPLCGDKPFGNASEFLPAGHNAKLNILVGCSQID
jgi:hypothetical protein